MWPLISYQVGLISPHGVHIAHVHISLDLSATSLVQALTPYAAQPSASVSRHSSSASDMSLYIFLTIDQEALNFCLADSRPDDARYIRPTGPAASYACAQFPVHMRPVRLGRAAMSRLRASRPERRGLQDGVGDRLAQRPGQPSGQDSPAARASPPQRLTHRRWRGADPSTRSPCGQGHPQIDVLNLACCIANLSAGISFLPRQGPKGGTIHQQSTEPKTWPKGRHDLGIRWRLILGTMGRHHFGIGGATSLSEFEASGRKSSQTSSISSLTDCGNCIKPSPRSCKSTDKNHPHGAVPASTDAFALRRRV